MARKRKSEFQKISTKEEEEEIENEGNKNDDVSGYEQLREQRIRENMERMQKLGILELSHKLKPEPKRPKRNPSEKKPSLPSSDPPRRSSRLQSVTPVSYNEVRPKMEKGKKVEIEEICIKEGSKPEIYTEEDEKLLGDCKEAWTLLVDGYGEDGERIYDPYYGKSCHQCRQKTLGHRTSCSKCTSVQGKFCGDCLYTRYGENILEANQNPSWICPVCRGICNCSRCRRAKGWAPTCSLYRKVARLGFKSVAHYLIHTYQSRPNQEVSTTEDPVSGDESPSADIEAKSSVGDGGLDLNISPDEIPNPQLDDNNNVKEECSDEEYNEEDDNQDESEDESGVETEDD